MAESANSLLRVQRSLFSMASVVQIGYTTLTQRFSDTLTSGCATSKCISTKPPRECCVTYIYCSYISITIDNILSMV